MLEDASASSATFFIPNKELTFKIGQIEGETTPGMNPLYSCAPKRTKNVRQDDETLNDLNEMETISEMFKTAKFWSETQ
jgi:hypothetical protein